jgi:hypothetical protein
MRTENIAGPSIVNIPGGSSSMALSLKHTIRVVASLPVNPDPDTTYYVGAQDFIEFTGLDGDTDILYNVIGVLVGGSGNDAMSMQINGITTLNYDWRYGYTGTTSAAGNNNDNRIQIGSMQGLNALNMIDLKISAETGKNRNMFWDLTTTGVSQQAMSAPLSGNANWRNSSSNLTSLRFMAPSVTGMYGVGTVFRIFSL